MAKSRVSVDEITRPTRRIVGIRDLWPVFAVFGGSLAVAFAVFWGFRDKDTKPLPIKTDVAAFSRPQTDKKIDTPKQKISESESSAAEYLKAESVFLQKAGSMVGKYLEVDESIRQELAKMDNKAASHFKDDIARNGKVDSGSLSGYQAIRANFINQAEIILAGLIKEMEDMAISCHTDKLSRQDNSKLNRLISTKLAPVYEARDRGYPKPVLSN